MQKFPKLYTHANLFIIAFSCALPSCFHSFHSHASWNNCCGKKKPPINCGIGEKAARLRLWMSIMLGLLKMPYCCAAKSKRKDAGAR